MTWIILKKINDKYKDNFSILKLKESFTALSKAYINLSTISPRYEFIAEACIQKVANSLKLDFSRDSLYEFDFLAAIEGLKTNSYDRVIKELADTMLHRYLLGGVLDTNINPSNIEHYNELYKKDPILGIKRVIEDKDIKFNNTEIANEHKKAIEKEPERLKEAMENMERTIDFPIPT